ncbi:chemotaxis protein CheB [Halopseudomonas laoshanensis]|uniref:protein-glutamate methylesterase n=1 Tax=Halopseudomonas laoshanensis TaxID=2268758 RepID=A0A7V7GT52_9GAMM|nr:chemotaxis protein CheB [Halopseudomonas laoshanensis]KAA0693871.1 chemotaxis protein CheB [Halopseudomonas laoshanensis]
MAEATAPAIGLLAGNPDKRRLLTEVLQHFGYRISFCADPGQLDCQRLASINTDAWLLELPEESALSDWLLEHSAVPVLLGAGEIPAPDTEDYPRWERRLYNKLLPLLGPAPAGQLPSMLTVSDTVTDSQPVRPPARCVWLLGASLGGPAAVKVFLDSLPADLPVAFIYAQHIDAGFEERLPGIIGRQNDWRILNCVAGSGLHDGDVLVAPIKRSLSFSPEGRVRLSDTPWPGLYQPSIETLLDQVGDAFAPACGAIIFSGMGEDGVQACRRLRKQGVEVWTQDPNSAACSVMPEAVMAAGFSSRQGTPVELAAALQSWLAQEWPVAL